MSSKLDKALKSEIEATSNDIIRKREYLGELYRRLDGKTDIYVLEQIIEYIKQTKHELEKYEYALEVLNRLEANSYDI